MHVIKIRGCGQMRYKRAVKCVLITVSIALTIVGIWWWQWQAPYWVLLTFLRSLERGDTVTLYNLTPSAERRYHIITPELIQKTYQLFLRPQLIERYRLVRIKRTQPQSLKPEIWIRSRAVRFYLYYCDDKGNFINPPLVVYVTRPLDDKGWRIPFSYFVFTTAHSLIGFDETQGDAWMYRVGYRFVYFHDGGVMPLKPPR